MVWGRKSYVYFYHSIVQYCHALQILVGVIINWYAKYLFPKFIVFLSRSTFEVVYNSRGKKKKEKKRNPAKTHRTHSITAGIISPPPGRAIDNRVEGNDARYRRFSSFMRDRRYSENLKCSRRPSPTVWHAHTHNARNVFIDFLSWTRRVKSSVKSTVKRDVTMCYCDIRFRTRRRRLFDVIFASWRLISSNVCTITQIAICVVLCAYGKPCAHCTEAYYNVILSVNVVVCECGVVEWNLKMFFFYVCATWKIVWIFSIKRFRVLTLLVYRVYAKLSNYQITFVCTLIFI